MIDERFIILGFVIQMIGNIGYIVDVLKGRAKPNRVSWSIWTAAPLLAFFAQLDEGVGMQALLALSVGLGPLLTIIASFFNKDAYWELKRFDYFFGGLAVIGLALWLITGEGLLAISFALAADAFASIPTIVKSYHEPESETSFVYGLGIINGAIVMLTISIWTFEEFGYPLYILLVNLILYSLVRFKLGHRTQKEALAETQSD